MTEKKYLKIVNHYSKCFKKYGETHKGVDWPNNDDLLKRFQVMLNITQYQFPKKDKASLLDFGCGFGLFLDFINQNTDKRKSLDYYGIDLCQPMIQAAKKRWPKEKFLVSDILVDKSSQLYDYVIMNGVLTEKVSLSNKAMKDYAQELIKSVFRICNIGIAFNVMNPNVDWKRKDLFYWQFDDLTNFLTKECSKNYIIRADYGLYEYTIYLFKSPNKYE